MKRILIVLLCIVFLTLSTFAGCSTQNNKGDTGTAATTQSPAGTEQKSAPVEISVFGTDATTDGVSLNDGLPVWNEIEKKLNVKFKWNVSTTYWDVITTKLAAGQNLEDIYCLAYENPTQYIEAGLFIPLTDLIDQYAPNIKKFMEEYPFFKAYNTYPVDGKMYFISESTYMSVKENDAFGFIARRDWLEKLSLPVPESVDDFYNVLTAFKNRDPNGNGKADEIPVTAEDYNYIIAVIGQGFGLHGLHNGWIYPDNNGVIVMEQITEPYKQLLMFMNKLYKENLLDPQFENLTNDIFKQRLAANSVGVYPRQPAAASQFADLVKAADSNAKHVVLPALKSAFGGQINELAPTEWKRYGITKDCKNPEVAMKVLDFVFADTEGYLLRNFGIENDTYKMVDGKPEFTEKVVSSENVFGTKQKYGIGIQVLPMLYPELTEAEKKAIDPGFIEGIPVLQKYMVPGYFLPRLIMTKDMSERADKGDLSTYLAESMMNFITGKMSFDKWDEYVAQCKKLGIEDLQKVYQELYDVSYK